MNAGNIDFYNNYDIGRFEGASGAVSPKCDFFFWLVECISIWETVNEILSFNIHIQVFYSTWDKGATPTDL